MAKFFIALVISAVIAAGVFVFRQQIADFSTSIPTTIEQARQEISAPPPLRAEKEAASAFLTRVGVIRETNKQRQANGLPPLAENSKLNAAASAKVQDMFARQYFAHESPDGKSAADLVENAGYEFIAVGENLALGNFENDAVLVQAWMDSPGHRANILGSQFQEIGAAVMRGEFEGHATWLAVQEFAKPIAACPQPDKTLKSQIESLSLRIDELKRQAEALRAELESYRPKRGPEYRAKVEQYNAIVDEINGLIAQYRNLVSQYNAQVQGFNACVAS